MAFKLPVVVKQRPVALLKPIDYADLKLPDFHKAEFSGLHMIGQGSYGKVLCGMRNNEKYVIKELSDANCTTYTDRRLFVKEAQMLQGLQGHGNIVNVRGFSTTHCAILLDFYSFDFAKVNIPHQPVSSLKAFLASCDEISDFDGFEHVQFHLATDICAGLAFLHSHNIVHRDLKPDNVLVSNLFYLDCSESEVPVWWSTKPVTAVLTDFGEARSKLVQTKTVSNTSTHRLFRGSPAYMAPEATSDNGRSADIEQLKMMDVYSLGMVFYMLVNPNAQYPYACEIDDDNEQHDRLQALRVCHARRRLPRNLPKYKSQQVSVWKPLNSLFRKCADFVPQQRPMMNDVCQQLLNEYVCVAPLPVSQSSVTEMLTVEALLGVSPGVVRSTDKSCTFLALLIANRLLQMPSNGQTLAELCTDVIVNFGSIPLQTDPHRMYSVDEAYKVLVTAGVCQQLDFSIPIYSNTPKAISEAQQELRAAICSLLMNCDQSLPMCAMYTCPPYTMLICRPSGGRLSVIDTHIVSKTHGGCETGAILTSANSANSVAAICSWLFKRLAVDSEVQHELSVITPALLPTISTANHNANHSQPLTEVIDSGRSSSALHKLTGTEKRISEEDKHDISSSDCDLHEKSEALNANGSPVTSLHLTCSSDIDVRVENENCKEVAGTEYINSSVSYGKQSSKSNNRWKVNDFSIENWNDCPELKVEQLPHNIDGWCRYMIACDDVKQMMALTKDGRPWDMWHTSSRVGFNGTRRLTHCKGTLICSEETCLYRKQYGHPNKTQFVSRNGTRKCFSCGSSAGRLNCKAVKVWEYDPRLKRVTVYHNGLHVCSCKRTIKNATRGALLKAIRSNPHTKPSRLVNSEMTNIMSTDDFRWEDVETVAEKFADMKAVQNVRDAFKRECNPFGENFEALALFREKCNEKDEYLIYRVNNRGLNGEPSYVFKSSLHMAKLALSMDRHSNSVMSAEYAHVDATHTHCRDFKTITLWTYHPVLRKLLRIAVMEVEHENTENLTTFWQILNDMLRKVSADSSRVFNPAGFVADEHHANWNSIRHVFGNDAVNRTVSCEFHYRQSVHRHARTLGDSVAADEFVILADAMLMALGVNDFNEACAKMSSFTSEHSSLADWYKWWYTRRTHIFRAFKPVNAPASNLAEVGHAKLQSVGRPYMSLLEAAREDVASAIRQDTEIKLFENGLPTGGRGASDNKRKVSMYKQQLKRAAAYAADLAASRADINLFNNKYVPLNGRHCPPVKRRKYLQQQPRVNEKTKTTKRNPEVDISLSHKKKCMRKTTKQSTTFHVVLFNKVANLKRCYGCGKVFSAVHRKPPHDLILKNYCHRQYINKQGVPAASPNTQACYYHLNLNCTRRIEPNMELTDIIVHSEIKEMLTEGHRNLLETFGIMV